MGRGGCDPKGLDQVSIGAVRHVTVIFKWTYSWGLASQI